uniref:Large ribosomal subunit protein eL28 n=1 Tax=Strigamia maritima TaxID=126957 RepID=T1IUQ7_STRMM
MSADLQWMIVRNCSSFMLKRRNIGKPFNKGPGNLKNLHSFHYDGLVRNKVLGIEAAPDGKGIVLVNKKLTNVNKPVKSHVRTVLKHGPRKSLHSIRKFVKYNKYRKDLKMAALRRASAILKSQKPVLIKKRKSASRKAAE